MFGRFIFIAIALCLIGFAASQTAIKQFTASVSISNIPGTNPGSVLTAKIFYDFTNTAMRLDYPNIHDANNGPVSEIFNYQTVKKNIHFGETTSLFIQIANFLNLKKGV